MEYRNIAIGILGILEIQKWKVDVHPTSLVPESGGAEQFAIEQMAIEIVDLSRKQMVILHT